MNKIKDLYFRNSYFLIIESITIIDILPVNAALLQSFNRNITKENFYLKDCNLYREIYYTEHKTLALVKEFR